ncbi:hypothetical protein [uncultured Bacteroides sp.]|uniref:hypothetical protein n=1 Tax=uncultured Bacteroides sp. TaxID=162156 RepID=UPI0025FCF86F|nr:hypothetical protein [uncultured Bacteroides sp.]
MKKIAILYAVLAGNIPCMLAQEISMTYTAEWQLNFQKKMNICNLLRLDANIPVPNGGEINAVTIHLCKTGTERIIGDWQVFSNIEEDNQYASIAVLGYTQQIGNSELFLGIRNLNEDYFIAPGMSLFTNSSCGIFPTISDNYPIANYPLSSICINYKVHHNHWIIRNSLYSGKAYGGWNKHNNPFIINLRDNGLFSITESNYYTDYGMYFMGFALHNRMHLCNENAKPKVSEKKEKKVSLAWWTYLEQALWRIKNQEINLLAQYSQSYHITEGCTRYIEIGSIYKQYNKLEKACHLGISTQYARYTYGTEISAEMTCRKHFGTALFIQPTFHLAKNGYGWHSMLSVRLSYTLNFAQRE